MGLSNRKEELKLKWTKYCVFIPTGDDSDNDHGENIIFFMCVMMLLTAHWIISYLLKT